MIIFLNILLTIFYWFFLLTIIKKIPINYIIKGIFIVLIFIGYISLYYFFYNGSFNIYNYLIILFTFIYIFIYK